MTLDYILSKRDKFNGLLIDTNLLLLLLVGLFDENEIGKVKRTEKYTVADFNKLKNLLNHFQTNFLINTNILTELCNLSDSFNNKTDLKFFIFLESIIKTWNEDVQKSSDIIQKDKSAFYKFGMTDASISQLAEQNTLVVTDDLKLYHYLSSKNYNALNYSNLMVL